MEKEWMKKEAGQYMLTEHAVFQIYNSEQIAKGLKKKEYEDPKKIMFRNFVKKKNQ